MPLLLLLLACAEPPAPADGAPEALDSSPVDVPDDPPASYVGPAYGPCVSDAQCDPGSACTSVPGHAGLYCAPPCDPDQPDDPSCDLPGLGFDAVCASNGRCARVCEGEGECPESLACSEAPAVGEHHVCAGGVYGGAGFYGTCGHPNVDGPDCPAESSCFGGDYLGIDEGACLPWCDTGECPTPPDDASAVSPVCYDVGLPHPVCALLCVPSGSTCPDGQECFSIGSIGICAPPGADY